ncbi:MAG: CTP synthase, partial [uncultured Nocardioidaceae bacterium]
GCCLEQHSGHQARLRHRRRRVVARQGADRLVARQPAQGARPARHDAEARPVPQRRPRDDEPVPARGGLRHRRRCGDRPGRRPLRAFPRHRPVRDRQRHHGPGLLDGHRQGAPRRLPGRHRAGHPAHHERDQGADPRDERGPGRQPRRRRHHRGRRDGRRHRVTAVPR